MSWTLPELLSFLVKASYLVAATLFLLGLQGSRVWPRTSGTVGPGRRPDDGPDFRGPVRVRGP